MRLKITAMPFQFKESRTNLKLFLALYDVYGIYMYALWTWDMLLGHGICLMDMEYALWIGYALWTWDWLYGYALWTWNMLSGYALWA